MPHGEPLEYSASKGMNIKLLVEKVDARTVVLLLPTIVALFAAGFFFMQWQKVQQDQTAEVEQQAQVEEVQALVEEIGQVVVLPAGELPTVSTIKDPGALTENREFFGDAQEGDKVLVYEQARKAFLYRPSTKKLINLAPINVAGATQGSSSTPTPSTNIGDIDQAGEVLLLNGTTTAGITASFASRVAEVFPNVVIADRANAARQDYTRSVIVPVNEAKQALVQQIAERFGFVIGELPADEVLPDVDILVILGSDQVAE